MDGNENSRSPLIIAIIITIIIAIIITIIIAIIITVLIIIAVIVMFELMTLHYSDHRYHSLSPCTVANVAKVNFLCHSLLSSELLFHAICTPPIQLTMFTGDHAANRVLS